MKRSITIKNNKETILKITVSGTDEFLVNKTVTKINELVFRPFDVGELIIKEFIKK
jgi:hypothetical protein